MTAKIISITGGKQATGAADNNTCLFSLEITAGADGVLRGGAYVPDDLSAADLAHIHMLLTSHARQILEKYEAMAGATK